MYSVIFLCDELFKFVKEQGFKESTLRRYRRGLDGFIKFCDDRDVIYYTPEIGQEFANDLIPKGKNKVSVDRKSFRRKAVQHFDHYLVWICCI